jgi:hypothetical protein
MYPMATVWLSGAGEVFNAAVGVPRSGTVCG